MPFSLTIKQSCEFQAPDGGAGFASAALWPSLKGRRSRFLVDP